MSRSQIAMDLPMTAERAEARRARVLIVDDDAALAETLADELASDGFETVNVTSSREAARLLEQNFDAVVTDLRMPSIDGLGILARSRELAPGRPVIGHRSSQGSCAAPAFDERSVQKQLSGRYRKLRRVRSRRPGTCERRAPESSA